MAVDGADGGTAVLEPVMAVGEPLDVPLPRGGVGKGKGMKYVSNCGGCAR